MNKRQMKYEISNSLFDSLFRFLRVILFYIYRLQVIIAVLSFTLVRAIKKEEESIKFKH